MKLKCMMIKQEEDLVILFVEVSKLNKSLYLILGLGEIQFGLGRVV
jgi:hypothetical protein